jgi:hypothetical protein
MSSLLSSTSKILSELMFITYLIQIVILLLNTMFKPVGQINT